MDRATILIVDDKPENLQVLSQMLSEAGYGVRAVTSGKMALTTIERVHPDLILLDVMMPGIDGYEVCTTLKKKPDTKNIPVIFISALDAPVDKVKAFKTGAVDYITKPFHLEEVQARVETHLQLQQQKQEIERLREEDRRYFEEITQIREELVHSITHELKSPLAVIYSYAGIIQHYPEIQNNEKLTASVSAIKRSAMNLSGMISNILEAAKIEAGIDVMYKTIIFNELVEFQIANFQSIAARKNIPINFHNTSSSDALVNVDERLMGMAISNLLSNAIKYTPEDGCIDVFLETSSADEAITLSIKDTGIGIPEDDIENIFKRFHRVPHKAHLAIEGTGLGLSIVEAIIQQHNGHIHVESDSGEGTTFFITLSTV